MEEAIRTAGASSPSTDGLTATPVPLRAASGGQGVRKDLAVPDLICTTPLLNCIGQTGTPIWHNP